MIDKAKFQLALETYKKQFDAWWPNEKYKWQALKCFQDNWDINAFNFVKMFDEATNAADNLLASAMYYPKGMILSFAKEGPEAIRKMFHELYNETSGKNMEERIRAFRAESERLRKKYDDGSWKNHYQDARAVSTYLWLQWPEKYYVYKFSVYSDVAKYLSSDTIIKKGLGAKNVVNGFKLYDEIRDLLAEDEDLTEMYKSKLDDTTYDDGSLNTLTFDFGYFISRILCGKTDNEEEMDDEMEEKAMETIMNSKYDKYIKLLKANHNIILSGAPGTGKTYLAKAIAKEMGAEVEFVQFHPSYDYTDFVEGLRPTLRNGFERRDGVFKAFCKKAVETLENNELYFICNNNSFESIYESIIEDVKTGKIEEYKTLTGKIYPIGINKSGNLEYSYGMNRTKTLSVENIKLLFEDLIKSNIKDLSIFKSQDYHELISRLHSTTKTIDPAQCAWILQELLNRYYRADCCNVKNNSFVFIIDEINRGEISKIFGELFFSIDPGYRGEDGKVQTQYQNLIEDGDVFKEGFFVPENVYIIGTMNDIDRSVEPMDFAMRRRFTWMEITAEESAKNMPLSEELVAQMKRLNEAIAKMDGFNESYQLGGAYFLDKENPMTSEERWQYRIYPLLKEYLRGVANADEELEKLKKAYDNPKAENKSAEIPTEE